MTKMNQNCYAFACEYAKDKHLNPGQLGGHPYASTAPQDMINAAYVDGLDYVGDDTIPMLGTDEHIVALFTSSVRSDAYHWLRRKHDKSWDHKPGNGVEQKNDARDRPINDIDNPPHRADFDYDAASRANPLLSMVRDTLGSANALTNYNTFVGYFKCPNNFPRVRPPLGSVGPRGTTSCRIL